MLNVRVLNVVFSPTTINVGERVRVDVTVQNLGNSTIKPIPPAPGYVYMQGQACERSEKGYIRVGVNYEGRAQTIVDHPYRWGLPNDLHPGESATITGYIQMTSPQNGVRYWVGLVEERVAWLQDKLGVTQITVMQGLVAHGQNQPTMQYNQQQVMSQPAMMFGMPMPMMPEQPPVTTVQAVQTQQVSSQKMCASCGSMIASQMKFCPNCGAQQPMPQTVLYAQQPIPQMQAPIQEDILQCAFCKGSGEHPFHIDQPCPICNETGKIKMRRPYMQCKKCDGSGMKPYSISEPCPRCNGKGVVPEEIR